MTTLNDILYLHDTEQIPFGKLSPLYKTKLSIANEEASNIISYCYAGLVKQNSIKDAIMKESGKEARKKSFVYFREEMDNIYIKALEESMLERVRQNKDAEKILVESSDSIIIYQSWNEYLGVNNEGKGQNKLGNILMNIRKIIKKDYIKRTLELNQKQLDRKKYNINIVYKTLEDKIKKGTDNLYGYLNKTPEEIIEILQLPSFPGKFDRELDYFLSEYIINPTKIASDLRDIHAEEYNNSLVNNFKKEVLHNFLIKQALNSLPSDYNDLYKRWKQIEFSYNQEYKEEYQKISEKIKPIINDIRDFVLYLKEKNLLEELEDRIYELYKNGAIPEIKMDKHIDLFLPIENIKEEDRKKYTESTKKLVDSLKNYQKEKDIQDEKIKKENEEMLKRSIKNWKDSQKYLTKLEKYYLRKSLQKIVKEDIVDDEIDLIEDVQNLREYYSKKYPKIYEEILDISFLLKQEVKLENLLNEYIQNLPKSPAYWKDGELIIRDKQLYSVIENLPNLTQILEKMTEKKQKEDEQPKEISFFKFSDDSPLSPSFVDMIEINNFYFPNSHYYIYFRLILSLIDVILKDENKTINPIKFSHDLLMIDPELASINIENYKRFDQVSELFRLIENQYIEIILKKRAKLSLYTRFNLRKNAQLSKLLIATNPKMLIYDDKEDEILGSGPINKLQNFNGKNIIGKIMMVIRDELIKEYGQPVIIEELEERDIIESVRQKKEELDEFSYSKTKEFLYIFIAYVSYIKYKKSIDIDDVKFVLEKLYHKSTNYFDKIKTPRVDIDFQSFVISFVKEKGYQISQASVEKLWSYIYVLDFLIKSEIEEKQLNLFNTRKVEIFTLDLDENFIKNIDNEEKSSWFSENVKNSEEEYGKIWIELGLVYKEKSKKKILKSKPQLVSKSNLSNLDVLYNSMLIPLLNMVETDKKTYEKLVLTIYTTNINLLRKEHVSNEIKNCDDLLDNKYLSCSLKSFIHVINKIKYNNNIDTITPNVFNFVKTLFSVVGNADYFSNPSIIDLIKKQHFQIGKEDKDLQKIATRETGLEFSEKISGTYIKREPKGEYIRLVKDLNIAIEELNFKNSDSFTIMIMVDIVSDRKYNRKFVIKGDKSSSLEINEEGDDIPISFELINRTLNFKIDPYLINTIQISYNAVSKITQTNLTEMLENLSKDTDTMARMLSFIEPSEENVFQQLEEEYLKQILEKNRKVRKESEESDESDEDSDKESDEDSDEERDIRDSYQKSDDEEPEEEEEDEDYYEEDE
jgi:predicted NAD-dependent protein-ADP-ribosyltransferase YbiA (DUF1768 family)